MNWSEHIPLVTLIAVVFSAGVLYAQHAVTKGDVKTLVDKTVPRIHERLDDFKSWQDRHEAETSVRRRLRTEGHGVPIRREEDSDHG